MDVDCVVVIDIVLIAETVMGLCGVVFVVTFDLILLRPSCDAYTFVRLLYVFLFIM